jgi:amino acid transporter
VVTSETDVSATTTATLQRLAFMAMAATVVGSMVGAGVFSLPRRFAQQPGVAGALVAWAIAGAGMLMLAFVFQTLAVRKPNPDAGVYAYAKAGFGEYLGSSPPSATGPAHVWATSSPPATVLFVMSRREQGRTTLFSSGGSSSSWRSL